MTWLLVLRSMFYHSFSLTALTRANGGLVELWSHCIYISYSGEGVFDGRAFNTASIQHGLSEATFGSG